MYENNDNLDKKVGFFSLVVGSDPRGEGMALNVDPITYIKEVNIKV